MPLKHRTIPDLPLRPRLNFIPSKITRSYTAGKQHFSRAFQGEAVELKLTASEPFPEEVSARLAVTRHLNGSIESSQRSFQKADSTTLVCNFIAKLPGLHSFRAEYSLDKGNTWLPDVVPNAWVLVDPPQVDSMRLYTMIPSVSGNISDWKADLKRIAAMGFNALHLLPITTRDTSESPYSAKELFSVDQGYLLGGSSPDDLAQLEDFIDVARGLGMRLCFDLVLNHVGVDSAIAKRAPDWIVPDQGRSDGLMRARYWCDQGWKSWEDLVLINYEHPSDEARLEIWSYMTDYALFWAKYANDTGGFVRLDNLHGSDSSFMQALTRSLRSEFPEVAVLAEYFTDEQTIINTVPTWGLNLLLATPWEHKYVPDLREHLRYVLRVSGQIRFYSPVTSHDSGTPVQEFGSANSTLPRYVAAALIGNGATGIVQGVEFAEREKIDFIGIRDKVSFPPVAVFGQFIACVNSILAEYTAFRNGPNCTFVDNGHDAVIAAFRQDEGPEQHGFLVVCNFDIMGPQAIRIDLSRFLDRKGPSTYTDLLTSKKQTLRNAALELNLDACATHVFKFHRTVS